MPTDKTNDGVFIIEGEEIPMDEVKDIYPDGISTPLKMSGEATIKMKVDRKFIIQMNWMITKTYFKMAFKELWKTIKLVFDRKGDKNDQS